MFWWCCQKAPTTALNWSFSLVRPDSLILLVLAPRPRAFFSGCVTTSALPKLLSLNSSALMASQNTVVSSAGRPGLGCRGGRPPALPPPGPPPPWGETALGGAGAAPPPSADETTVF